MRLKASLLGKSPFGIAPIHERVRNGEVYYLDGKVYLNQEFDWHGDPERPPRWAEPLDAEGRAAYARQDELFPNHMRAKRMGRRRVKRGGLAKPSLPHGRGVPMVPGAANESEAVEALRRELAATQAALKEAQANQKKKPGRPSKAATVPEMAATAD